MRVAADEQCPRPDDAALAATATALNDAGYWAEIVDREWRTVFHTDDARRIYGGREELAPCPIGTHFQGPERVREALGWRGGQFTLEVLRDLFAAYGPWILADTLGGRDELRALVAPELRDMVDELSPVDPPEAGSFVFRGLYSAGGTGVDIHHTMLRLRDHTGQLVGTALVFKPAVGMAVLTRMTAMGDLRHFERMEHLVTPRRRPTAVLFADLESSSSLARGLSTASYFALVRRLAHAADRAIIDAGGLVGSHAGDGVVGFFLAATSGSESAAARACISAARAMRAAVADVSMRSDLLPEEVVLRFGLHWGSNLYVGQITTSGRTEVTALGDQVNEAARIEACATGGRALASKDLIERLDPGDAVALDIDPDRLTYTRLADLSTATGKARRDAPAIPVCDV